MSRIASIEVFREQYMEGPEDKKPAAMTIRRWCERWEREQAEGVPLHKRKGLPSIHLPSGYHVLIDQLGMEPSNCDAPTEEHAEQEEGHDPGKAAAQRLTG